MRKSMVVCLVVLVALCLQGCPVTPIAPVAPITAETTNEVVTAEVVPTPSPIVPVVAVQPLNEVTVSAVPHLGGVTLVIDLRVAQVKIEKELADKVYSPLEMIDAMKRMATTVRVELHRADRVFTAKIIDGFAYCECPNLEAGLQEVQVILFDQQNFSLFSGGTFVEIIDGVTSDVTVVVKPWIGYNFNFVQPDLVGAFDVDADESLRHTMITERNGRISQAWWNCNTEDPIYFTAFLPLNFTGGEMTVTDSNGQQCTVQVPAIPALIDWSTFQFGDIFGLKQSGSLNVGVTIDTSMFGDPVDAAGEKLPTVKLTSLPDGTTDVVISENDYHCESDGFWSTNRLPGDYSYFSISYVVNGQSFAIDGVGAGVVHNIPTPDSISVGLDKYYSVGGQNIWFDDSLIVATFDGMKMAYQDHVWLTSAS